MFSRRELIKKFGYIGFALHPIMLAYRATAQTAAKKNLMFIYKGNGFYRGPKVYDEAAKRYFPHVAGQHRFWPFRNSSDINKVQLTPVLRGFESLKSKMSLLRNVNIGQSPKNNLADHHSITLCGMTGGRVYKDENDHVKVNRIKSINLAIGAYLRAQDPNIVMDSLDFALYKVRPGGRATENSISFPGNGTLAPTFYNGFDAYNDLVSKISKSCNIDSSDLKKRHYLAKSMFDKNFSEYQKVKNSSKFSPNEIKKLENHIDGLRDIEVALKRQLATVNSEAANCDGPKTNPGVAGTTNQSDIVKSFGMMATHVHKWGLSRVSTLSMSPGAHGASLIKGSDFPDGYHATSHKNKTEKYDYWHMSRVAEIAQRFNNSKDISGNNLLDKSAICFFSDMEFGYRHSKPLGEPLMVLGKGDGYFKPGYYDFGYKKDSRHMVMTFAEYMGLKNAGSIYKYSGKLF